MSLAGAALLHAEVPDAGRFDPGFATHPPQLRVVDWKNEPVLDSQHDARKRIYVVTPRLFGTRAIKGEMIIYKTVWGKDEPVCTWAPSGRNIRGEKPVRDIKAHGGTDLVSPQDV